MKTYCYPVIVDRTYSPVKLTLERYHGGGESQFRERGTLRVTIPETDGRLALFGRGEITCPSGSLVLTVAQNVWATVHAGGCDLEWQIGRQSWAARIESGTLAGCKVSARGQW